MWEIPKFHIFGVGLKNVDLCNSLPGIVLNNKTIKIILISEIGAKSWSQIIEILVLKLVNLSITSTTYWLLNVALIILRQPGEKLSLKLL